jgi:hypothetical protein
MSTRDARTRLTGCSSSWPSTNPGSVSPRVTMTTGPASRPAARRTAVQAKSERLYARIVIVLVLASTSLSLFDLYLLASLLAT